MKDIYNIIMSTELKADITTIYRGINIEEGKYKNATVFKKELDFLEINKIEEFINKLNNHYNSSKTVQNKLNAFVNLLSRIDSYSKSYQILTKYNSTAEQIYIENKSDNKVETKDLNKLTILKELWDYKDVDKINTLITDAKMTPRQQLIAAIFLLQPPRRLDHQHVLIINKDSKQYDRFNYLIVENGEPLTWIYNNFKTAKTGGVIKEDVYGKQTYDVLDGIIPYLKKYINDSKLEEGDFLFHNSINKKGKTDQGNFSKEVKSVMKNVFKVDGITATTIRTAAAMYNQKVERTLNQKTEFATQMAHSNT
jgi:hypothetical protein